MLKVEWIDGKREPQCQPDQKYPDGMPIDMACGRLPSCFTDLPYPAARCGMYIVECDQCGQRVGIMTAGRPDDPRSVRVGCRNRGRG